MRNICKLTVEDLPEVMRIERLAFSHPWPEEAFREFVSGDSWVIHEDDVLAGYIICHSVLDESTIVNIAVDPPRQHCGLGRAMLEHAIRFLAQAGIKHIYLDVRVSNAIALNLYLQYGFKRLGLRRNYYTHPDEDALVMVKSINAADHA
jgi:ribosomal-protein-alanine N-acetyltransferase